MAFTTQIVYTISGTSDRNHAYGTIETFDDTSINDSDILQVSLNGSILTLITHYTVDDGVAKEIVLDPALTIAADDTLVILRVTDIDDTIVDYTNNSVIDADDLNLSNDQLLFAIQELNTDSDNSLQYDVVEDCYDALNRRICKLASGTSSSDAVNLGQVQNLIAGTDTAAVDDIVRWNFTGDGTTTVFTLTSPTPPAGLNLATQVMVYVDGVFQLPTTNYTLTAGGTTVVTFTTAPLNTTVIQVLTVEGIVAVTFPDGSIDGDAIADNSITNDHINVGVGDADRFNVYDINGDPVARVIVHDDMSDFDTGVRENRLDQMAAPTSAVSFNSKKITSVLAGSVSTDGVNKGQMDAAITAAIPSAVNKALGGSETITGLGGTASIALPGTAQMITFRHKPSILGDTTEGTIFFSDLPHTIVPTGNSTWTTTISDTGSGLSLVTNPGSASGNVTFEYGIITN